MMARLSAGVNSETPYFLRTDPLHTDSSPKGTNKMPELCPECGAEWQTGQTCQDDFHHMLFWEAENPALGEVHHLTVLCYHLQHPSLYSPEGLEYAKGLLAEFIEHGAAPQDIRKQRSTQSSSEVRAFKITGTPESHGAYSTPVEWTQRARDVVQAGADQYLASVRAWAQSVYDSVSGKRPSVDP
jgi:hypothetical protein